jgi:hypothetical protein
MDDLQKLSASGGNDNFAAGTYKFLSLDVATVTLTSATSAGTATITANGLAKVATYATSKAATAAAFVAANADAYKAIDLIVTNSGDTVIFTSNKAGLKVTASIVNLTTDLTGTVAYTKNEGTDTATFTPSATGTNSGLVTVNGLSKSFVWDTNVGTTSAAFVAANATAYAAVGVTLTGTVTLIFTVIPGSTITDASVKTLTGDATATIVRASTKLPREVYAFNVAADAVVTSYKYLDLNGRLVSGYKQLLGATLAVGYPVTVFERPVVEIVIASGTLTLDFVK